jgi:Tfp pilus assembly protein PilN
MAGGHRLPELPTILIAGHHFFTDTVPLVPGTAAREIPALAALALEQEAPFAEEQMACGYYAAPADAGLVVFASLRRKFAAAQESWGKAGFVLPDFATWLPRGVARPCIVVLETAEAVTALEYAAGSALPRRIVSRPVPPAPAAVPAPAPAEAVVAVAAPSVVQGVTSAEGAVAVEAAPALEGAAPVQEAPVVAAPEQEVVEVGVPSAAEAAPAAEGAARVASVAFDGVAVARELVLARIERGGRPLMRYRLADIPCTVKGSRYYFHWEALAGTTAKSVEEGAFAPVQLWTMDLRESESLRTKRRDFQWNRLAWGTLVGLGAASALLLLAEVVLLGGQLWLHSRQARIDRQVPLARQAETNQDVVERLSGYIDRKPQPLEQLAYVNDLRPRSIYFTKVSVEAGTQMVIEGATAALAEVNEFEAALTRSGGFASVEVKNTRSREGGGTFQLSLAFRPGAGNPAFAPDNAALAVPTPTPATPAPSAPAPIATPPPPRPKATGDAPMVAPRPVPGAAPSGMGPQPGERSHYGPVNQGSAPRPGEEPWVKRFGPRGMNHPSPPTPDTDGANKQAPLPGDAQPAPSKP